MLKNSSNNHNKSTFSETVNITEKKVICKDGFCSLPNQKDMPTKDLDDMNLFDPV